MHIAPEKNIVHQSSLSSLRFIWCGEHRIKRRKGQPNSAIKPQYSTVVYEKAALLWHKIFFHRLCPNKIVSFDHKSKIYLVDLKFLQQPRSNEKQVHEISDLLRFISNLCPQIWYPEHAAEAWSQEHAKLRGTKPRIGAEKGNNA